MATILYARVSTAEQTIEHQLAHARSAGFTIEEVVSDNGVSGLSTRLVERSEGRRLFDKLRAGDVLVVRWVDRLASFCREMQISGEECGFVSIFSCMFLLTRTCVLRHTNEMKDTRFESSCDVVRWLQSEAAGLWPALLGSLSFRRSPCVRENCPAC
ncbi:MAG TPA: recombinase family protein, partial [Xanthobacteraceae bacterium]|nr:recombinase family protein [Xanthobacteraceae bacterium]